MENRNFVIVSQTWSLTDSTCQRIRTLMAHQMSSRIEATGRIVSTTSSFLFSWSSPASTAPALLLAKRVLSFLNPVANQTWKISWLWCEISFQSIKTTNLGRSTWSACLLPPNDKAAAGYLRNLTDLFKFKTQGFWIEKPEVRKLSGRLKSSHFRLYGMRVI